MKVRTKLLWVLCLCFVVSNAQAATTEIRVTPQGDGTHGKDRWGYGSSWDDAGFDSSATPNTVDHWYEYGSGQYRNTYLQFDLSSFSGTSADIVSATFNFYLISTQSNGINYGTVAGNLYHASNSSSATGFASDKIGGNEHVGTVNVGHATGWVSWDITSYIQNDIAMNYTYSAFSFMNAGYAGMRFASGETENGSFLQLTTNTVATPVPATLFLFGTGLAGLIGFRRRRS